MIALPFASTPSRHPGSPRGKKSEKKKKKSCNTDLGRQRSRGNINEVEINMRGKNTSVERQYLKSSTPGPGELMAERAPAPQVFFSALIAIWRRNYPIRELGWSGVGSGCEVLVITNNPSLTSFCSALCLTPTVFHTKDGEEIALYLVFTLKRGKKKPTKTIDFYQA